MLLGFALPWWIALLLLAQRWASVAVVAVTAIVLSLMLLALAAWRWRSLDSGWLRQQLNQRYPALEDSADLLFTGSDTLNPLQRLQQQRLQQRLRQQRPDLRQRWPLKALAVSTALAAAVAVAACWPATPSLTGSSSSPTPTRQHSAAKEPVQLQAAQLRIQPPAYTHARPSVQSALDVKAVSGTQLQWQLRFSPQPRVAALQWMDGSQLPLQRDGDLWRAQTTLKQSTLYRVMIGNGVKADGVVAGGKRQRLEVVPDHPPRIKVLQPEQSLSLVSQGQQQWQLLFEAEDDYGVSGSGHLRIILAQGSGENVRFSERQQTIAGSGDQRRKRYSQQLSFADLGLSAGDEVIVQLSVSDNRQPSPQTVRSQSLILRWPADLGQQASGLEGIVKQVLPAYFRSQRQIIIDAEALLKQKPSLAADRFVERSDAIGVDQRILRLRYGQFLGEESEGKPMLPTNDADSVADDEHDHAHDHEHETHSDDADHDPHVEQHATAGHDGHDHAASAEAPGRAAFGSETDVLSEYGHTHDHAEAATLLDPETRATLKQALDQMWQSELHLRQGDPKQALPYAYKALGLIKQVQQASRIYLARVGPELPPIDPGRRLSGERKGIVRPSLQLTAVPATDEAVVALWQALAQSPSTANQADLQQQLDALQRWLRQPQTAVADPLSVHAALERVREQPGCAACRQQLRAQLWSLLALPAAQVSRRAAADAQGRAYLRALQEGPAAKDGQP
ncbi:hypothetical protein ABB29_00725 [Pseudoxanthomonas dokdonensis]|uniref:DUF4175 domain-containing protein n=2 Tax=Pseudoxanthomonas dokdonensis TaxID=344882 RepID=A0A0R0D0V2_9GAMM|nr:hypothetical protein ABB29_00725 [Pseudoxanthomonas dokdonensis]